MKLMITDQINIRACILYISLFSLIIYLLSPLNAWVHPEIQLIDNYLINSQSAFYKNIFNWSALEFAPRYTRPLSSLVQIIDSALRHLVPAKVLTVVPSISITWIITLYANPKLVFKICRQLEISYYVAVIVSCIYLFSSTNLSDAVMFFRPGKPLAQMFLMLSIYYALNAKTISFSEEDSKKMILVLILGLVSDESGWIAVLAVLPILFLKHQNFFANLNKILLAIAGILITYIIFLVLHRQISFFFWGLRENVGNYFILKPLLTDTANSFYILIKEVFWLSLIHSLVFFRDFTGFYPFNNVPIVMKPLMLVSGVGVASIVIMGIRDKNRKWSLCFLVLTVVGLIFHSLLMAVAGNKIFGPYYYGGYVTLFFLLAFGLSLDNIIRDKSEWSKRLINVLPLALILASAFTFIWTNNFMKYIHYYKPGTTDYREMFSNTFDRFSIYPIFKDTYHISSKFLDLKGCMDLPVELLWLGTELNVINGAGFPPGDKTMRVCK